MRSNTFRRRKSDSGSALIEVLVAIVLGSLLIGLVLHADLAVNRRILRWSAQSQLEQAAATLTSVIRRDIVVADSIVKLDALVMELLGKRGRVEYLFGEGRIRRNGIPLLKRDSESTGIKTVCAIIQAVHNGVTSHPYAYSDRVLSINLSLTNHSSQTVFIPLRPLGSVKIE